MNDEQKPPAAPFDPAQEAKNGHASIPAFAHDPQSLPSPLSTSSPDYHANGATNGDNLAQHSASSGTPSAYTSETAPGEPPVFDSLGEPEDEQVYVATVPQRPVVAKAGSALREIVETVILALLIFLAVRAVVQNFRVEGSSMYPSFIDGQYVLVNKAVYGRIDPHDLSRWLPFINGNDQAQYVFHAPRRGDVVVFHPPPPNDPTRDFIKRVIGVPGDTVDVRQGHVFVNGAEVIEPFIHQPTMPLNPRYSHVTLGKDQFFVMGDNRGNSSDSRQWGPVRADEMVGRAWLVYWPFSAWKVAPNHVEHVPAAAAAPR